MSVNSIKCNDCGLICWATAETCKRCGVQLHGSAAETISKLKTERLEGNDPVHSSPVRIRARRTFRLVLWMLLIICLPVGFVALKSPRPGLPQTFTLAEGDKATSVAWFHSWLSDDPSADEILAQYLKVSGWQANPSMLKTYVAKGTFAVGDPNQLQPKELAGELDLQGEAPNRLLFTQKYNYGVDTLQHGTNGTTAWWKNVRHARDPYSHLPTTTVWIRDVLGNNEITDFKRGVEFINYFQLANTYPKLYLYGKTLVGDRVAYVLNNKGSIDDAVVSMYFDVETGMLLKYDCRRYTMPSIGLWTEDYYSPSEFSEIYLEDY